MNNMLNQPVKRFSGQTKKHRIRMFFERVAIIRQVDVGILIVMK
jgi:hypothetical protein